MDLFAGHVHVELRWQVRRLGEVLGESSQILDALMCRSGSLLAYHEVAGAQFSMFIRPEPIWLAGSSIDVVVAHLDDQSCCEHSYFDQAFPERYACVRCDHCVFLRWWPRAVSGAVRFTDYTKVGDAGT